jgi:hypothetical protein
MRTEAKERDSRHILRHDRQGEAEALVGASSVRPHRLACELRFERIEAREQCCDLGSLGLVPRSDNRDRIKERIVL